MTKTPECARALVTVTYTYRADGLWHSKTANNLTTTHVWNGAHIVLERNGSGAVVNRFIRGAGGRLLRSDHHGWYLHNARGDVVQRVDNAGVVLRTYIYDAFGVEQDQDERNTNPFRYAGEYYDWATGTIYLRARVYDPRTGRFTQEDPFWNTGNMQDSVAAKMQAGNLYMYTMHNPVAWVDPSGLAGTLVKFLLKKTLGDSAREVLFGAGATAIIIDSIQNSREIAQAPPPATTPAAPPAATQVPPPSAPTQNKQPTPTAPAPTAPVSIAGSTPASPPPPGNENEQRVTTTRGNIDNLEGEPNSIIRQVDSNGRIIKERQFGPDGRARVDIHYSNHGNPKTHPDVPHRHFWDWSNPSRPVAGPSLPMR